MAVVVPRQNFWPLPLEGGGGTVYYGVSPIVVAGQYISVLPASGTSSGVVDIGAQSFAGIKNLIDGIQLAGGQLVTSIATDFTAPSDLSIPTTLAVMNYLTGFIIPTSVAEPLWMNLTVLSIRDASPTTSGVITTVSQSIEGTKTFKKETIFEDRITLTSATDPRIESTGPYLRLLDGANSVTLTTGIGVEIRGETSLTALIGGIPEMEMTVDRTYIQNPVSITNPFNGSYVSTNPGSAGGYLLLGTSGDPGSSISFQHGTFGSPIALMTDPLITLNRITNIISGGPQLVLVNGGVQTSFNVAGTGDITIDASGNDINMHSTDKVHVLNNTVSTSKTTGAFTVNGGAGISDKVYADGYYAISTNTPHFTATYTTGNSCTIEANANGAMILNTTGLSPNIMLRYDGAPAHTIGEFSSGFQGTVSAGTLEATDGLILLGTGSPIPTIRPNVSNSEVRLHGGVSSGYLSGASVIARSVGLGGELSLSNGDGGAIRMYSYPDPGLPVFDVDQRVARSNYVFQLQGMIKKKTAADVIATITGSGPFNNVAVGDTGVTYTISMDTVTDSQHITGISVNSTHRAGRVLQLYFRSSSPKTIYLDHLSASSSAANQFICPYATNAQVYVNPASSIQMEWIPGPDKWVIQFQSSIPQSVPISYTSTTVIHNLLGAASGSIVTVFYEKFQYTVHAHFGLLYYLAQSVDNIRFDQGATPIPFGYRPLAYESGPMVVIDGTIETNQKFGRWLAGLPGEFTVYAGPNQESFTGTGNIGWRNMSLTWRTS